VGKFSEEPGHREGSGTIDYLIFTKLISRPGWLIYSFFITFISMKTKTSSTEKILNLSDHFQGTRPLWLSQLINHPGRKQTLQYLNHKCTAAAPPSKGGENIMN
jgi:hypothetical protein